MLLKDPVIDRMHNVITPVEVVTEETKTKSRNIDLILNSQVGEISNQN